VIDRRSTFALLLGGLALVGCGASAAAPDSTELPAVVTSEKGTFFIGVRTSDGKSLQRGLNSLVLEISHAADGTPAASLTMTVRPWMPAMGHGTTMPHVQEDGAGRYLVGDVALYMPGVWELRTGITAPVEDHATLAVEIR
jgi:hypothetical protein